MSTLGSIRPLSTAKVAPNTGKAQNPVRIIITSADPAFRERVHEKMNKLQWMAIEAASGAEALLLLSHGGVETLLLDNWLPDLNADELQTIVKHDFPNTDVLLMDVEGNSAPNASREPSHPRTRQLIWELRAEEREAHSTAAISSDAITPSA